MAGFGLYVHWPFCAAKCPYCDFNSHVRTGVNQDRWARAFEHEVARNRERTGPRVLTSIFFGGGTPSLMDSGTVARVIAAARASWSFANDIEITLEANPTSVEAGRFQEFADTGVNRVSVGIQALNDHDLKALGRTHSVQEGLQALIVAKETFSRVSLDLMYGRQNQHVSDWHDELKRALDLGTDHLSLYQLTIEPETVFGARAARGLLRGLPDEDASRALWDVTQEMCRDAGFAPYEISNFSRSGQESRHNLTYWRSGDWVGVGPGAHGRITTSDGRIATETALSPEAWLDRVSRDGSGETSCDQLTSEDILEERLLMGLRLTSGIEVDAALQSKLMERVSRHGLEELVSFEEGRILVQEQGRPLLNSILKALV